MRILPARYLVCTVLNATALSWSIALAGPGTVPEYVGTAYRLVNVADEPARTAFTTAEKIGVADCVFATPPRILDGSISSRREMQDLAAAMGDYVAAMQRSLKCLDAAAATASSENGPLIDRIYNTGVDQLNFIVDEYNKQVQIYQRFERVQDAMGPGRSSNSGD